MPPKDDDVEAFNRTSLQADAKQLKALQAAGVPAVTLPDPCRACDEPCPPWPKMDIDHSSALLGSTQPFGRLVACSTGKDNWPHSVTDEAGSVEHALKSAYDQLSKEEEAAAAASTSRPSMLSRLSGKISSKLPALSSAAELSGIGPASIDLPASERSNALTVLSSSHHDASQQSTSSSSSSLLVFPDYKVVHGSTTPKEHAEQVVQSHLLPSVERFSPRSSSHTSSFPLPYRAVLMICPSLGSHRNRDKRCAISAPPLIEEFKRALEHEEIGVDEYGEELECRSNTGQDSSIESWSGSEEDKDARFKAKLAQSAQSDTVGIFKISHMGGHKFAGNVYVCLPSGACILYGRVTPTEVESIVKQTILQGKVIEEMLRGGVGLSRGESVLSW